MHVHLACFFPFTLNQQGPVMKLFSRLFSRRLKEDTGTTLYRAALAAARQPALYGAHGAQDTVDGRFDILLVHVWLLIRHIKRAGHHDLGQAVFDAMFRDMDDSLRELGTSDTVVGKRIKDMARAFYGRSESLNALLDEGVAGDIGAWVQRNVSLSKTVDDTDINRLSAYIYDIEQRFASVDDADVLHKMLAFPAIDA